MKAIEKTANHHGAHILNSYCIDVCPAINQ